MAQRLYEYQPHTHTPRNANDVHKEERTGWGDHLADIVTANVGTMQCAGVFFGIGVGSIIGVWTNNYVLAASCGAISSYILQLVLLPVILKKQNTDSRKADIIADETYKTTLIIEHHGVQADNHRQAQDNKLIHLHADVEDIKQVVSQMSIDIASRDNVIAALLAAMNTRLDAMPHQDSSHSSIFHRMTHPLQKTH
jgi:hypothetical protein